MELSDAILQTLQSPNVCDSNFEDANVVDVINALATATSRVANAITPNIAGNNDASGTHVASLTEAVMGVTAGLFAIAGAINDLAEQRKQELQNKELQNKTWIKLWGKDLKLPEDSEATKHSFRSLNFSGRLLNVCFKNDIHTVSNLVGMTPDDFLSLRNVGDVLLREVREKLATVGLKFKGDA
jgi:hypothetical protein